MQERLGEVGLGQLQGSVFSTIAFGFRESMTAFNKWNFVGLENLRALDSLQNEFLAACQTAVRLQGLRGDAEGCRCVLVTVVRRQLWRAWATGAEKSGSGMRVSGSVSSGAAGPKRCCRNLPSLLSLW